jgi:hypothetical protein
MERRSGKRSSSAGSENMERVGDIGQNEGTLFDSPKPTTDCSANGRRRRRGEELETAARGVCLCVCVMK